MSGSNTAAVASEWRRGGPGLKPIDKPGVWECRDKSGNVFTAHVASLDDDSRFRWLQPELGGESGVRLFGWQLTVQQLDALRSENRLLKQLEEAIEHGSVTGAMVVLGMLVSSVESRQ